jgi:HSP20 family protein
MDVFQTEQGYQVTALLPGIQPEHIELSVQQNALTLKGQYQLAARPEQQGNWLLQEIGVGTFERSITFPQPIDADRIETSYERGVLIFGSKAPVASTEGP